MFHGDVIKKVDLDKSGRGISRTPPERPREAQSMLLMLESRAAQSVPVCTYPVVKASLSPSANLTLADHPAAVSLA